MRFYVECYRRDEIDASHYPVFHKWKVLKFLIHQLPNPNDPTSVECVKYIEDDLKVHLEGMVKAIFGDVETRWVDAYFPFESIARIGSIFQDDWLEVLGGGVIQQHLQL